MKYWVQFLTHDLAGKTSDALGSDGVYILDGRNSMYTMHADAKKRAQRMQHFKKFVGYQLVRGSRFTDEVYRGPIVLLEYPIQV